MGAEKPGVLERLGSALNSSDLTSSSEGKMGAVDLIAALAYTQTNPDAAEHAELEAAPIDPRTELASVLVRLKYAGDRVLGERAVHLLTHWVHHQKAYGKWKVRPGSYLLQRFVRQCLAEWLYPVCPGCHGRTLLGADKGDVVEKRIRCTRCRGTGTVHLTRRREGHEATVRKDCLGCRGGGWKVHRRVRAEKTQQCNICNGTGRRRAPDGERAHVLGIEHKTYERHWLKRFDWLTAGLDRLDRLEQYCLQSQLRAGITRA